MRALPAVQFLVLVVLTVGLAALDAPSDLVVRHLSLSRDVEFWFTAVLVERGAQVLLLLLIE